MFISGEVLFPNWHEAFLEVPADSFYENLLADTKVGIWKFCWFFFVKLFGRSSLQAQQSLTMTRQFKARGQLYNICKDFVQIYHRAFILILTSYDSSRLLNDNDSNLIFSGLPGFTELKFFIKFYSIEANIWITKGHSKLVMHLCM